MAGPTGALAEAGPDGPDTMGREIAQAPDAVAATLLHVEALRAQITELLADPPRVIMVGTGASLAVCRIAAPIWRRALPDGVELLVRQSTEAALGDLDGLHFAPTDAVVAISQSGSSPETLSAARMAQRTGASVMALTADPDSLLASTATLSVPLASGREAGAATKSAMASLAGLLGIAGSLRCDEVHAGQLRDHLAGIAAAWGEAMDPGQRLAAARHAWMLGFGAAEGIAAAGSLLWHEKVVRPATAATPSEFRHGLIEAVRRDDVVVLFRMPGGSDSEAGYLDRLRSELGALEVDVVELRPVADDAGSAALELLLRIQVLARAAVLAAGTYRDEFAILRHVVKPADDLLA
jgi:glutamine---fructose-6-phosphate transaminase (isomerizing)